MQKIMHENHTKCMHLDRSDLLDCKSIGFTHLGWLFKCMDWKFVVFKSSLFHKRAVTLNMLTRLAYSVLYKTW